MKRCVIDASVSVKWFVDVAEDEQDADVACGLLEQGYAGQCRFIQPSHWIGEVADVLARLQPESASRNIDDLLLFNFHSVISSSAVYRRAIALAHRLDHHLFDTLYHAVALEEKISFITADRQYFKKARKLGNIVMLDEIDRVKVTGK